VQSLHSKTRERLQSEAYRVILARTALSGSGYLTGGRSRQNGNLQDDEKVAGVFSHFL